MDYFKTADCARGRVRPRPDYHELRAAGFTHEHANEQLKAVSRPDDNTPHGRDTIGHSSVQAWSAGDLFPAVITVAEVYRPALTFGEWKALNTPLACHEHARTIYAGYLDMFYNMPLERRLVSREYRVQFGAFTGTYRTYADAVEVARALLRGANPDLIGSDTDRPMPYERWAA